MTTYNHVPVLLLLFLGTLSPTPLITTALPNCSVYQNYTHTTHHKGLTDTVNWNRALNNSCNFKKDLPYCQCDQDAVGSFCKDCGDCDFNIEGGVWLRFAAGPYHRLAVFQNDSACPGRYHCNGYYAMSLVETTFDRFYGVMLSEYFPYQLPDSTEIERCRVVSRTDKSLMVEVMECGTYALYKFPPEWNDWTNMCEDVWSIDGDRDCYEYNSTDTQIIRKISNNSNSSNTNMTLYTPISFCMDDTKPKPAPERSKKLSYLMIIGIIFGGVAFLMIFVGAGRWLATNHDRTWKRNAVSADSTVPVITEPADDSATTGTVPVITEPADDSATTGSKECPSNNSCNPPEAEVEIACPPNNGETRKTASKTGKEERSQKHIGGSKRRKEPTTQHYHPLQEPKQEGDRSLQLSVQEIEADPGGTGQLFKNWPDLHGRTQVGTLPPLKKKRRKKKLRPQESQPESRDRSTVLL